jgi:hypothetical protein
MSPAVRFSFSHFRLRMLRESQVVRKSGPPWCSTSPWLPGYRYQYLSVLHAWCGVCWLRVCVMHACVFGGR